MCPDPEDAEIRQSIWRYVRSKNPKPDDPANNLYNVMMIRYLSRHLPRIVRGFLVRCRCKWHGGRLEYMLPPPTHGGERWTFICGRVLPEECLKHAYDSGGELFIPTVDFWVVKPDY